MNVPAVDGLARVKAIAAETFSGTFPSWIRDESSGGSTAAYDATHAGGYWELDPGTKRPGDEAALRTTFAVRPDAYDVVEVASRVSVTTTDGEDLTFTICLQGEDGDGLAYSYLHGRAELTDRLRVRSDGSGAGYDVRRIDDEREHDVVLRWYTTRDRVELYTDHVLAATVDAVDLNADDTFVPTWRATYAGGRGAVLRVHAAAVRYYEQGNP